MNETTGGTTPGSTSETSGADDDWTSGPSPAGGFEGEAKGREWVSQLQSMIDNVATQATPVLREIGAKAAELAAAAGEKAGPFAHRAAEVTEAAGAKLAERGRAVADELRRDEGTGGGAAVGDAPNAPEPGATTSYTPESTTTAYTPAPGSPGAAPPVSDRADSLGE